MLNMVGHFDATVDVIHGVDHLTGERERERKRERERERGGGEIARERDKPIRIHFHSHPSILSPHLPVARWYLRLMSWRCCWVEAESWGPAAPPSA